jgi:hypothetical protein
MVWESGLRSHELYRKWQEAVKRGNPRAEEYLLAWVDFGDKHATKGSIVEPDNADDADTEERRLNSIEERLDRLEHAKRSSPEGVPAGTN